VSNQLKAFNFVFAQFVLLFLLVAAPRDDQAYGPLDPMLGWVGIGMLIAGLLVVGIGFFGLGRTLTVSPVPKSDGQLVTSGMYSKVRHPIYSGLLLLALGIVLDAGYWPQLVLFVFLFVLLNAKANYEEELLKQKYPDYKKYAVHTPRFFPRIGR
jgi:protein-S-isoprenylcysteine O-methyltransferase Ste14